MKRLIDLNSGSLFEDTRGMVGSAPYKLGEQRRQVLYFLSVLFSCTFLYDSWFWPEESSSARQLPIMRGSILFPSIIDWPILYEKRNNRS
jgi:hypothetical protein